MKKAVDPEAYDSSPLVLDDRITEENFIPYVSERLREKGIQVPEVNELELERYEDISRLNLKRVVRSPLEVPRIVSYEECRPYGFKKKFTHTIVGFEMKIELSKRLLSLENSPVTFNSNTIDSALREFYQKGDYGSSGEIEINFLARDDKSSQDKPIAFKLIDGSYRFSEQRRDSSYMNSYRLESLGLSFQQMRDLNKKPIKESIDALVEFYDSLRK